VECLSYILFGVGHQWQSHLYLQVWFDSSYKLMRLDYRPSTGVAPYYSNDTITEIHDYTIGNGCLIVGQGRSAVLGRAKV
jgi:hypothetical protein